MKEEVLLALSLNDWLDY